MSRPPELLRSAATALRQQFAAASGQSERTFLRGTILLASGVSVATMATNLVPAQYHQRTEGLRHSGSCPPQ